MNEACKNDIFQFDQNERKKNKNTADQVVRILDLFLKKAKILLSIFIMQKVYDKNKTSCYAFKKKSTNHCKNSMSLISVSAEHDEESHQHSVYLQTTDEHQE